MHKNYLWKEFEMKTLSYLMILFAALVMVPMLFHIVMAQDLNQLRAQCMQKCDWLAPHGSYHTSVEFYKCRTACARDLWNEFHKRADELKGEFHEPK